MHNPRRWLVAILCWLAIPVATPNCHGQTLATPLTNASQVRALSQGEAGAHLPVKLRGIAISEAEPEGSYALLDPTAGIYFRGAPALIAGIERGDLIEVDGYTDPGEFAPFVQMSELRIVGRDEIPPPRPASFEQLITGRADAQWVEVSGIVRSWEPIQGSAEKYRLELATGGGRLAVQVNEPSTNQTLVDAEVVLRGVCFYQVNRSRQVISPLLLVPKGVPIHVQTPAPETLYSSAVQTVGSLLQFAPQGSYGHRVHVRGAVTHVKRGEFLWLQDDTGGLRVETRQSESLRPGDVVDVLGFPNRGDYTPVLQDAVFRKSASGPAPTPIEIRDTTAALNYDAALVGMEATLAGHQLTADGWAFILHAEGGIFRALLHWPPDWAPPGDWPVGSTVRVTGICSVIPDKAGPVSGLSDPRSFQILLRSPGDIQVLRAPPWWTWEHVVWVLGLVAGGLSLAVAAIVWSAKKRLREQANQRQRAEAEFSAILSERNRMAREIHDTLAQSLGAISVQLELAKSCIPTSGNGAEAHVEQAHQLVRSSLADARNSIWNMRSQVLETGDLASALQGVLRQLVSGTPVLHRFQLRGVTRRLPPVTENNLLRVGQEAITNAIRHAQPTQISVELEFTDKEVRLRVEDDGKGFNAAEPTTEDGRFGLVGLRERARELRAGLRIRSAPGQGTQITLIVPVTF